MFEPISDIGFMQISKLAVSQKLFALVCCIKSYGYQLLATIIKSVGLLKTTIKYHFLLF